MKQIKERLKELETEYLDIADGGVVEFKKGYRDYVDYKQEIEDYVQEIVEQLITLRDVEMEGAQDLMTRAGYNINLLIEELAGRVKNRL